jgi:WD repeat-containing protein 19
MFLRLEYAAVLSDGQVLLHPIEPNNSNNTTKRNHKSSSTNRNDDNHNNTKTFPDTSLDRTQEISCIALTKDFFIFSTTNGGGSIQFFYLKEWKLLEGCTYRHEDDMGIVYMAPNTQGRDSARKSYQE